MAEIGLCLPGEVLLYANNGELVKGRLDWSVPDGPITRHTIGTEGIPFQFNVWQNAKTSEPPIDHIEFWMISDEGLEKITVTQAVPPVELPQPAWGPTVQGLRCRIRSLKERYSLGEEIRIGFEVESDHKSGDALHAHFDLTYDGKTVRWFDVSGWHFPYRTSPSLRDTVKVTPGRHKLQVTVQGKPGKDSDGDKPASRTFDGTLVSNELEIEVFEAIDH